MRDTLLGIFAPPPQAQGRGAGWTISPQLTLSEQYTSNPYVTAGGSSTPRHASGGDSVTIIAPELLIAGTGERLRVNLDYAPTGEIFAANPGYSQFRQQFNGDALATAIPSLLFLDLRGNVFQQPVFGGVFPAAVTALAPSERETISSAAASPYISHDFGGVAAFTAGIGYIYTATDAPNYLNQPLPLTLTLPYNYGSSWLATKRIFATLATGENFGRFQNALADDTNFYDGSGALRNAQRLLLTDDASYAINRFIAALGEIGYENLNYPNAGFHYVGGVWAAGARLTPNADSTLTAEWRYVDGNGAPYIYGSWQITPRLRAFGGYSEGITNFDQDQQNTLLSSQTTATGAAASALIAAPLLNNAFYAGSNQSLSRTSRLDATAAFITDRDIVTLSANWQRDTILGTPLGLPASELQAIGLSPSLLPYLLKYGPPWFFPPRLRNVVDQIIQFAKYTGETTNYLNAGLAWRHDLRPDLTADLMLGYTRTLQAQTVNAESAAVQVSAAITETFSRTLFARLAYAGSYNAGSTANAFNLNATTVTLSVTKKF